MGRGEVNGTLPSDGQGDNVCVNARQGAVPEPSLRKRPYGDGVFFRSREAAVRGECRRSPAETR
jgi:hypothetical protein